MSGSARFLGPAKDLMRASGRPVEAKQYARGIQLAFENGQKALLTFNDPLDGVLLALDLLANSSSRVYDEGKEDTIERLEEWTFGKKEE